MSGVRGRTRSTICTSVVLVGLAGPACAQLLSEQQIDAEPSRVNAVQPTTVPDPTPVVAVPKIGEFSFGGQIRARLDIRFDDVTRGSGTAKTSEHLSYDLFALKGAYDSPTLFAAAQYRFYGGNFIYGPRNGYNGYPGELNFPLYAYLGYKLNPADSITAGITQVPFGVLPYFTTSFYESLGFAMGVEDVYNLGIKYSHVDPVWNWQVGFFPSASINGMGISKDSTRYSTNIVKADSYVPGGTRNSEENMLVGRAEYNLLTSDLATASIGASIWYSTIHNYDTRQNGTKNLESVHFQGTYGNWGTRLVYVRQDINAKNPNRNDLITVGSFDASYNMATRGNLFAAELNYKMLGDFGPFSSIVPYFNYSTYMKDGRGFKDSERFISGAVWTLKADPRVIIYTEIITGRNDPYIGAGQFLSGLAQGGDNKWKNVFFGNIGFYF